MDWKSYSTHLKVSHSTQCLKKTLEVNLPGSEAKARAICDPSINLRFIHYYMEAFPRTY